MRDYFLQQLGIGEVWKLRTPTSFVPEAKVEVQTLVPANDVRPSISVEHERSTASQSADIVLMYRHPDAADAALLQDSLRLYGHIFSALSFNQTLKLYHFDFAESDYAQVVSAVLSLRPTVILVLGAIDACNLLSLDSATESVILRQGDHCLQDIPVIVTHELSALLHQPSLKREFWMDLCRVKNMFVH